MPQETIKEVLMRRDNMTAEDADDLIEQAREDFYDRLASDQSPDDICEEWFGLEPDYLDEFI